MKLSNQRQGELFIVAGTLLWGMFPVFALLTYSNVSPFTSLAISSLFAAMFFAALMSLRGRWKELRNAQAMRWSLYGTFFIGILYYLLFFLGVRYSNPGNVSILALAEAFFSFLLFHVWHKNYIPKEHIIGALLMLTGAAIVLAPTLGAFQPGNVYILLGAAIAPLGNFYVQKARKIISTETIMFVRGIVGGVVIFLLSQVFHSVSAPADIVRSLPFMAANGLLMLGLSTNFWVEGIHRISVTKANALSSLGPLITLLFSWIILKTAPTTWQLLAFLPMFFGVILLGKKSDTL